MGVAKTTPDANHKFLGKTLKLPLIIAFRTSGIVKKMRLKDGYLLHWDPETAHFHPRGSKLTQLD